MLLFSTSFIRRFRALVPVLLVYLWAPGLSAQTYSATIQSAAFGGNDYIIDAEAGRDTFAARVITDFTRAPATGPSTVTFRYRFRLLRPDGTTALLKDSSGNVAANFFVLLAVDFGSSGTVQRNDLLALRPGEPLSPDLEYRLEVTVQREFVPGSFVNFDTATSAPRRYWHFTGTQAIGTQRNVLARIASVSFARNYALATGATPADRAFLADVEIEVRRYDGWTLPEPNINNIEFRATARLADSSSTTPIPLHAETGGVIETTLPIAQFTPHPSLPGFPEPSVFTHTLQVPLRPDAQLATVAEEFRVFADLEHIPVANTTAYTFNTQNFESATAPLFHFNGDLFAAIPATVFTMERFSSPTLGGSAVSGGALGGGGTYRSLTVNISRGFLKANPGYTTAVLMKPVTLQVRLLNNGGALFMSGSIPVEIPPEGAIGAGPGNLDYTRASMRFAPNGIRADVELLLPRGLGVRSYDGTSSRVFRDRLKVEDQLMVAADLRPNGPVVFEPNTEPYFLIAEETKPFEIAAESLTWTVLEGTITPGPTPTGVPRVRFVHMREYNFLDAAPLPAEEKVIASNDAHFFWVDGSGNNLAIGADEKGHAVLDGTFGLKAGSAHAHFPYGARFMWNKPGSVTYVANRIDPAVSTLDGTTLVQMLYRRTCDLPGDADCGGLGPLIVNISPGGAPLRFTRDGGLSVGGPITQNGFLHLGYIDALTTNPSNPVFAHRTSAFSSASFLMAGHVLHAGDYPGNLAATDAPGFLLNSGFDPADLTAPERPGTAAYLAGAADYPGFNYRVAEEPAAISARSVLGGAASPVYPLGPRSKYYTRLSGVSGIHEPTTVPFPDPVLIYGYLFEFDNFALSFLSSRVHDSRTIGSLYIPDPAVAANGFTMEFDPLFFSCLGGLTTAELANGPFDHTLAYWNADLTALAASFTPKVGAECDPGSAFFTLGVRAHASNIATPFHGNFLFYPNGDLVPGADPESPPGRDSRLSTATTLRFDGPGNETYSFTPLHAAYLNRHAEAPSGFNGTAQGFINLIGLLDVAFFRDLQVHLHTGARRENTTDLLHLAGGWTAGGETFFTTGAFDLGNRGFPPAAADPAVYRAGNQAAWRVHAYQEWLDVVNFDYPLRWDAPTRTFRSRFARTNDFLVLTTQHQLKYLSARTAEIDFGAALDVEVPEINLGGLTKATPLYAALHSVADTITDTLIDGLSASEKLLNDLVDQFFEDIFAVTIDIVTDALAADIAALGEEADLQQAIDDRLGPAFTAIENQITLASTLPAAVTGAIDEDLGRMQSAIDAVDDLFANSGTAENPRYNVAAAALDAVLSAVDAPIHTNLLASIGAAALDEAMHASLAARSASIEQVRGNLSQVGAAIGTVRSGGHLENEMRDLFTGSGAEVSDFLDTARKRVRDALDPDTLGEWAAGEINDLLRNAIRDTFNASPLIGDFHRILRSYVYELDAAMRSGIDSGFDQVNQAIIDIVNAFLPVDSPLVGFLGDLGGSAASGRIDGYARINGDALRTLRLDAEFEFSLPDPFAFNGYLEINQLNSSGSGTCAFTAPGELATEVKLGAENVKVGWLGKELRFNVDTKFTFDPAAAARLVGMAGKMEMTGGAVQFEAFTIDDLGAALAFGATENYLAAKVGVLFNGDRLFGGVFFGRTCSLDPLQMVDPDVARVLPAPNPTFTGAYVYGQAFIPIINVGCLFRVSATAGIGIFAFAEHATVGGKMLLGADARAICAVNVGGEIVLVGTKAGNDMNFLGSGRIYGSAGVKPLKVEFDKKVTLTYKNRKWDYDY
jgi:hypothetical protein